MSDITIKYDYATENVKVFKDTGDFSNNLDSYGNIQISNTETNDGKLIYVKIPLKTYTYDETKILDSNNVEFTELQSVNRENKQNLQDVLIQYNNLLEENRILNQTVNSLVTKYENSDDKQVIAALKDTIIDLRIQLKQGSVPSDFSDDFPFLPLK